MKRFISILLATLLVASCMSFVASADVSYYRFYFDSGVFGTMVAGDTLNESSSATVSSTATIAPNDSIPAKGWLLTTAGMKSLQYKIDDGEWTDVTLEPGADVTGSYGNELTAQGSSAEANANCRFNFSVPTTFADGETHVFTLRFVTNEVTQENTITNEDGTTTTETVVVAPSEAVEFATANITVASQVIPAEPVPAATYGKIQISRDGIDVYTFGNAQSFGGTATGLTLAATYTTTVTYRGWLSVYDPYPASDAFGYSIDGGEIVYGDFIADFANDADAAGIANAATYKDYYTRYAISVPVADLSVGDHTITTYLKLDTGWTLILNTTAVTVTGEIPSTVDETAWDIMLDNGEFTVTNLMESGNRFRNQWSPREGLSSFITLVTDENGDNYASMGGITEAFTDHTWTGPYGLSIDMKIPGASNASRGLYFSHCNVERKNYEVIYNAAGEIVTSPSEGFHVTNTSGVCVVPYDQHKVVIYVICYDDAENGVGYSAIDYVVNVEADLFDFTKFIVTDDAVGNIQIFAGAEKIATITYADSASVNTGICEANFYRTVSILNAAGETVASTDCGLIAELHRAAIVTRGTEFCFDNINFTAVDEVGLVEVNYVDAEGTAVADAFESYYLVGDTFNVKSPAIGGYTCDTAEVSGTATAETITNTVTYTATERYTLTINYVDAEGNVLAAPVEMSLYNGQAYSVDSPAIAGYTADVATVSGTMGAEAIVVTVTYTADVVETPTITLAEGSTFTLDAAKGVITIDAAVSNAAFLKNLTTSTGTGTLVLKNTSGDVVTSGRATSTGYTVELQVDGVVIETYVVAYMGDINSDGKVNSLDVAQFNSDIVLGVTKTYSAAMKVAANTNKDSRGTTNSADLSLLASFVASGNW